MEAKDTVIKEILATHGYSVEAAEEILNNAGRAIYQAGIREVVDWMNRNCLGCQSNTPSNTDEYLGFHKESWQAKLKEWDLA